MQKETLPFSPSTSLCFILLSAQHLHQSNFIHEELEKASWKSLVWQPRTGNKLGVHNFKRSVTKATPTLLPRVCLACSKTAREKSSNKPKLHLQSFSVIKKDSIATFIISFSFDYGFVAFSGTLHVVSWKNKVNSELSIRWCVTTDSRLKLLFFFPLQFVQHHKWAIKEFADWSAMRFQSRQIEKRCAPSFFNKSPLYSEAKSFTDCLRNLPEKCQQLLLSAVFLFPCLPGRLYLAIIDLQCVKGHRIEDDSSRSNHGDFLSLFLWLSTVSVNG